jgi:hypothetical protein
MITLFLVLLITAYILIKNLILENINYETNDVVFLLDTYNSIWAGIFILYLFGLGISFFFVKKFAEEITRDVNSFTQYLEEINKKNYEAPIQIQHYVEFLKMSLIFKNLVKRLKAKDKKQ